MADASIPISAAVMLKLGAVGVAGTVPLPSAESSVFCQPRSK
jgi:hypothetical protein